MIKHRSIQKTVYPFGYDKNGVSDRNKPRFSEGFNSWNNYIRESCMIQSSESAMNYTLETAKNLIGL